MRIPCLALAATLLVPMSLWAQGVGRTENFYKVDGGLAIKLTLRSRKVIKREAVSLKEFRRYAEEHLSGKFADAKSQTVNRGEEVLWAETPTHRVKLKIKDDRIVGRWDFDKADGTTEAPKVKHVYRPMVDDPGLELAEMDGRLEEAVRYTAALDRIAAKFQGKRTDFIAEARSARSLLKTKGVNTSHLDLLEAAEAAISPTQINSVPFKQAMFHVWRRMLARSRY